MTGARGAGAVRRQGLRGATRALRGYTGHIGACWYLGTALHGTNRDSLCGGPWAGWDEGRVLNWNCSFRGPERLWC